MRRTGLVLHLLILPLQSRPCTLEISHVSLMALAKAVLEDAFQEFDEARLHSALLRVRPDVLQDLLPSLCGTCVNVAPRFNLQGSRAIRK